MIDQNRDGFIDSEDLKDMLASLGKLLTAGFAAKCYSECFLEQDKSPVTRW